MSVLPKPLPNYTKITHIIKSQEPINENIEVDGKIWYCERSYFTSDDEFWVNQFFEINSSEQTIIRYVKCRKCGHIGDLQESAYFVDEKNFKVGLQCSQCQSRNVEPHISSKETKNDV